MHCSSLYQHLATLARLPSELSQLPNAKAWSHLRLRCSCLHQHLTTLARLPSEPSELQSAKAWGHLGLHCSYPFPSCHKLLISEGCSGLLHDSEKAPASSNNPAISKWPPSVARCNAVAPSSNALFLSAPAIQQHFNNFSMTIEDYAMQSCGALSP